MNLIFYLFCCFFSFFLSVAPVFLFAVFVVATCCCCCCCCWWRCCCCCKWNVFYSDYFLRFPVNTKWAINISFYYDRRQAKTHWKWEFNSRRKQMHIFEKQTNTNLLYQTTHGQTYWQQTDGQIPNTRVSPNWHLFQVPIKTYYHPSLL